MRLKNTLIWGVILLLLAGFVYYYEVKAGGERQRIEDEAKHIFVFEEAGISRLELQYADTHIQCVKTAAGEWQLVAPIDFPADGEAIQGLIDAVKQATIDRKLAASDQALSAYGLDNPQLKLTLASKDKEYKLLLGSRNPMGDLMYAKREADSQLFLLYSSLLNSLKRDVFELRDKRVISAPEIEVTQIELDYTDRKLVLTNDTQIGWQITTPGKLKADPDEVSSLIRQINSMRVKEFIAEAADNPAEFGLDKPQLKLTLSAGKEAQMQLLVGRRDKEKQGVYARRAERPQVMLLDSSITTELTKELFDLRERRILRFDTVRVNELELAYPEMAIQFSKEAGEWRLLQPEKVPVKGYMVESMLYDLAYLKAAAFIYGKPKPDVDYGFDKPQVKATLKLLQGDKSSTLSLLVGAAARQADDELVYVKRDDGQVFLVPGDIVEQLSKKPADLKRDIVKD